MKSLNDLPLRRCLGFRLSELGLEAAGVQAGKYLSFMYTLSFLHENGCDALAVIEGELHLAKVDYARDRA